VRTAWESSTIKTLTYALVATLGKHPKNEDSGVNLFDGLDRTKPKRPRQAARTRPVSSTASGPRQRAILIYLEVLPERGPVLVASARLLPGR
jgi:hypothetical protein